MRVQGPGWWLALVLLLPACGKKGPPLPPLARIPVPGAALQARQVEDSMEVVVPLPSVQMDGQSVRRLTGVKIYRLDSPLGSPAGPQPQITGRSFGNNLAPLLTLDESQAASLVPGGTYTYQEPAAPFLLPARPGREPGRFLLAYSARFRSSGRGWSPPQEPATIIPGPPPPPVLAFQVSPAPNGIRLAWEPVPGAGTAVYRAVPGEPFPFQPLAILPAGASSYLDQSVGRGERVVYQIRGVAGEGTEQRFSRASEPQQVTRTDTFPPAVPQGLVALARPGGVDLFWTAGEDEDLAGYRVYRRRPPEETWTRLTEDLVPAATWTDTTVQPGQLYAYAVTALDASTPANESARSAEQQVLVPGGGGRPPEDGQSDSQGAP